MFFPEQDLFSGEFFPEQDIFSGRCVWQCFFRNVFSGRCLSRGMFSASASGLCPSVATPCIPTQGRWLRSCSQAQLTASPWVWIHEFLKLIFYLFILSMFNFPICDFWMLTSRQCFVLPCSWFVNELQSFIFPSFQASLFERFFVDFLILGIPVTQLKRRQNNNNK